MAVSSAASHTVDVLCGTCVETLRQGLPVREQLILRATCAATKACLSETSVFWDEVLASRTDRGAKRGVLAHWLDYKRWCHRAVTESRSLRLRRLFAALRGPVLPQQFLDVVRTRQRRAAQRCLKELRARAAIRQDAVRRALCAPSALGLQRQCLQALALGPLLRRAFQRLRNASEKKDAQ